MKPVIAHIVRSVYITMAFPLAVPCIWAFLYMVYWLILRDDWNGRIVVARGYEDAKKREEIVAWSAASLPPALGPSHTGWAVATTGVVQEDGASLRNIDMIEGRDHLDLIYPLLMLAPPLPRRPCVASKTHL
jgi:hypothetical protein